MASGAIRPLRRHTARRISKPWGYELIWAESRRYAGKILHIDAGHSLSLQFHRRKEETIYVLRGSMALEVGRTPGKTRRVSLREGQGFHLEATVIHRMTALEDCDVLEVSTPELDDVVRLEDLYGRVPATGPSSVKKPKR